MARILVVEDEPDIALLLEDDLAAEGHQVEVVRDGPTASRRGREPGWDLIILDVMLPGRDGFDVCRDIRHARVRTPIIILSMGRPDICDRARGGRPHHPVAAQD